MWYSYQTCGGKDYWMTAEKKKELQAMPTSGRFAGPVYDSLFQRNALVHPEDN